VNNELEKVWRNQTWPNLMCCPRICMERRNTTVSRSQNSVSARLTYVNQKCCKVDHNVCTDIKPS
jgi:hypothetical protein